MRRLFALLIAVGCVTTAAMFSSARFDKASSTTDAQFVLKTEARNPWTSLAPNVFPDQFQFAVVSDRTGGHRKGIFSRAVQQVNLLQPEFVMSVGDLIEGSPTADVNRTQWDEFDRYAKQFAMPFFYCAGNHDALGKAKTDVWKERLGRSYYHFQYKNCLFLVLNSNDPSEVAADGTPVWKGEKIGKEQQNYIATALKENANVRWTFVFLHHPIWNAKDLTANGWLDVETLLNGRKYTVFCGHLHTFRKYIRNGMNYYQLATTGGSSPVRGAEYGEFDQIGWVTMKQDGPVLAHIGLAGVFKEDLSAIESSEDGRELTATPGQGEVIGKVTFDGKPAFGMQVVFTEIKPGGPTEGQRPVTGNARVQTDGSFVVYQNRGSAGLKPGRYAVTIDLAPLFVIDGKTRDNPIPEKYRTLSKTPFRVEVKGGERNQFEFNVEK